MENMLTQKTKTQHGLKNRLEKHQIVANSPEKAKS